MHKYLFTLLCNRNSKHQSFKSIVSLVQPSFICFVCFNDVNVVFWIIRITLHCPQSHQNFHHRNLTIHSRMRALWESSSYQESKETGNHQTVNLMITFRIISLQFCFSAFSVLVPKTDLHRGAYQCYVSFL